MREMSMASNAPGSSATYYLDGTTLRYRTEVVRGAAKDMAVCGSDEFIAMAFDRSLGGVLKHGPADRVAIGRAHVATPVTDAHLVCRLLFEQTNNTRDIYPILPQIK